MTSVLWWMCASSFAGAWTRDLGSVYAKAGVDVYSALRFQAPGEAEVSEGGYFGQQYGVYGEVGLSKGHPVQISLTAPLTVGSHRTTVIDAIGEQPVRAVTVRLGDLRVAAQTALHRKLPIAAAVEAKIPLYENGGVGTDMRNLADLFPKPGDGQIDITAWLYGGSGIGAKGFAEAGVGYLFRTEAFVGWDTDIVFRDGLRALVKGGVTAGRVILVGGVEGQFAWRLRDDEGELDPYTRQFVVGSVSALIDVAPGLAIEPRFAVELYARNASQGIGGGLGISYRR